ncbi:MAG: GNAT family N-acetyltransferase, partial [Roseobacter sp.]
NLSCSQSDKWMDQNKSAQYVVVRRLYAVDQAEICDHFRRLDIASRRARFLGAVSDEGVASYARSIFHFDSILCGAFLDGYLRGVVELRGIVHFWPSTTEAAFSVEHDWQNIGIGDALFERMMAMAQNRSIRSIQLMCLKQNARMRYLATKHSARLHLDQDVVEAVLYPYWPTPASVAKEIIVETIGAAHLFSA